jgi:hypothetical protein
MGGQGIAGMPVGSQLASALQVCLSKFPCASLVSVVAFHSLHLKEV